MFPNLAPTKSTVFIAAKEYSFESYRIIKNFPNDEKV